MSVSICEDDRISFIWLMLTGAYHSALSMTELASHGNEWSMYHNSNLVSTEASVIKTERSWRTVHLLNLMVTRVDDQQRVIKRLLGFTVIPPHMLIQAAAYS